MKQKYPVLIHKENNIFGVTIPDIPGCFTAGNTIEEALGNIQEAVECYYGGEEVSELPKPSDIKTHMSGSLFTEGGYWVLVEIDFGFLSEETVRVNISLPEYSLTRIDKAAREKGQTRSAFLIDAAETAISISNRNI